MGNRVLEYTLIVALIAGVSSGRGREVLRLSRRTERLEEEVEKARTFYEVEGKKKGTAVALKLTDAGRIVEEEKS